MKPWPEVDSEDDTISSGARPARMEPTPTPTHTRTLPRTTPTDINTEEEPTTTEPEEESTMDAPYLELLGTVTIPRPANGTSVATIGSHLQQQHTCRRCLRDRRMAMLMTSGQQTSAQQTTSGGQQTTGQQATEGTTIDPANAPYLDLEPTTGVEDGTIGQQLQHGDYTREQASGTTEPKPSRGTTEPRPSRQHTKAMTSSQPSTGSDSKGSWHSTVTGLLTTGSDLGADRPKKLPRQNY